MPDHYLVTGAMGCIGAWTLDHLVQQGKHAVSFDLSDNRQRLDLLMSKAEQNAITFVQGDLTSFDQVNAVMRDQQITHIVHLAALQVPFCRANPVVGAQVNVTGTVNIFEAARQNGIQHLTFASSMAVYGPASDYPPGLLAADAPMLPRTLYGVYKVADEGIAKIYWQDYQLSSTWLRPYTVYGLGRDQGTTSEPTKAMQAAAKGQNYAINFGGAQQFHYASDIARQFIAAAEQPLKGAFGFNPGGPVTKLTEIAQIIMRIKPDVQITVADSVLPFAEGCDGSAIRQAFAQVYDTPLEDGVRETIARFEKIGM
ncbi:MAG TPA: SDR family oxidoreductase [Phototrophicaceae bacterium]|nr:SDR family oxidoreductase [Phototrophicaceae bacterium]